MELYILGIFELHCKEISLYLKTRVVLMSCPGYIVNENNVLSSHWSALTPPENIISVHLLLH